MSSIKEGRHPRDTRGLGTFGTNRFSNTTWRLRKKTAEEAEAKELADVMGIVAERAAFYRANPQRFVREYLGITNLKWFQEVILYMMNTNIYFMYLASRGQGKTHILALFCCVRCILYPESHICVASKTRKQAQEVLERIANNFMPASPNLQAEIVDVLINSQKAVIEFHNGSRIFVVTANDNARSNRATMLIVDEFVKVDPLIVNRVLRKFLTEIRSPGYLEKPEYAGLQEQSHELYASSCWYESHWSFEKAISYFTNMLQGRGYAMCALPYQLPIKEGLLIRKKVEDEMSESDFSSVTFHMEMEALWWSDNDGGLYSHEDVEKTRTIVYPWIPNEIAPSLQDKKLRIPKKQPKERRILSADIALMASFRDHNNDSASLFLNSMQPINATKWRSNIFYTENAEDIRADDLALLIRRRADEFDVDFLVVDAKGLGLPIVDLLMKDINDPQTGKVYEAWSCCNNPSIAARCAVPGAPKKIWAVMGASQFNSDCALALREAFRQGSIRLPISEYDCEDQLAKIPGFSKLSVSEKTDIKLPYIHTSLLGNELINLEYESRDGVIKVHEKGGMRKDRYSALSYNIYVAHELERQMAKGARNGTDAVVKLLKFKAPTLT